VETIDVPSLSPLVAEPYSPANAGLVEDFKDVVVDQVFLGSCANGWIDDFRRFASVLGNKSFAPGVRVLAAPASQQTYRQALEEGILARIVDAGGAVLTPSCGPCLGAQCGVLAADEVCLSTSNRNFHGRMGHPDCRVYLASPMVAAATAVMGRIAHPEEV
jgi:3-isopropylmalate/(R)-2-methylmalate dehydratase large subunit